MRKIITLIILLLLTVFTPAQTIQSSNYGTTGYIKADGLFRTEAMQR